MQNLQPASVFHNEDDFPNFVTLFDLDFFVSPDRMQLFLTSPRALSEEI